MFARHLDVPMIPYDLQHAVVDRLSDDKGALLRCALVCRSWVPLSYRHLFRTLRVASSSVHDGHFDAFVQFLKTKPYMRQFIIRLELRGLATRTGMGWLESRHLHQSISPGMLMCIISELPEIDQLYLSQVNLSAPSPMGLEGPFRLTSLELVDVMIPNQELGTISQILSLFSTVSTIQFSKLQTDVVLTNQVDERRLGESILAEIDHVHLRRLSPLFQSLLLNILSNASPMSRLNSLQLEVKTQQELLGLGRMLHTAGPHLRSLHLNICDLIQDDEQDLVMLLSVLDTCTALTSFGATLRYRKYKITGHTETYQRMWMGYVDILRVMPTSLQHIHMCVTLRVRKNWLEDPAATDWDTFRRVVERFPGMKKLEFTLEDRTVTGTLAPTLSCATTIERMMPELFERGMLDLKIAQR